MKGVVFEKLVIVEYLDGGEEPVSSRESYSGLPQFTDLIASGMQGEDHQIEREQTSPCLGALLNRKYGLVATVRHSPYKNRMWN